jgi:SAM-dependent methyltransferase
LAAVQEATSSFFLNILKNLYGLEHNEKAIEFAKKKTQNHIDIRRGELPYKVPFDKNEFDKVFMLDVLEHIDDDKSSLKKIHEIIRPDGSLILTVPAFQKLWSKNDEINHHKGRYHLSELKEMVIDSGFKEVNYCTYFNVFLSPLIFTSRILTDYLGLKLDELKLPSNVINRVLTTVMSSERHFLSRLSFPIGYSALLIATK